MMRSLFVVSAVAIAVGMGSFLFSQHSGADLDPPGPPKVSTEVLLERVVFFKETIGAEELNDSDNDDAELVLRVRVGQTGHGGGSKFEDQIQLHLVDGGQVVWLVNASIYKNVECSSVTPFNLSVQLLDWDIESGKEKKFSIAYKGVKAEAEFKEPKFGDVSQVALIADTLNNNLPEGTHPRFLKLGNAPDDPTVEFTIKVKALQDPGGRSCGTPTPTPMPDKDGDGIQNDVDPCPNDPDNDKDGDLVCGDIDPFPNDPDDDKDGDGISGDVDACPNDPDNDKDGDGLCGDVDPFPNGP